VRTLYFAVRVVNVLNIIQIKNQKSDLFQATWPIKVNRDRQNRIVLIFSFSSFAAFERK